MTTKEVLGTDAAREASVVRVDMKLEAIVIPVADVDRAKKFYANLGWRLDADFPFDNGFRIVQFTPPGSGCSIQFGTNITSAAPGSAQGLYLIVSRHRGCARRTRHPRCQESATCSTPGRQAHSSSPTARADASAGPRPIAPATAPSPRSATRTVTGGCCRRSLTRLPGRIDLAGTAFASANDLASALRRAEAAHGQHEKRTGQRDANWPDWYAAYMVAEQAGKELPQ